MDKYFPFKVIAGLLTAAVISVAGGYALLVSIGPPVFKAAEISPKKPFPEASPISPAESASGATPKYIVLKLSSTAELNPENGDSSFEVNIENLGFTSDCSGKIVQFDYRVHSEDSWEDEIGAEASVDETVCLQTGAQMQKIDFTQPPSEMLASPDVDDLTSMPDAVIAGQSKAFFIQTSFANYIVYSGGVAVKGCPSQCDAGVAAGISITRTKKIIPDDRFLFAVPVGDKRVLNLSAAVPLPQ